MKKILITLLLFAQAALAQTLDIAVVGDGYKPTDSTLFISDLQHIKNQLFTRLWQRQSQINFIPLSWKNKFNCTQSTAWEGSSCNSNRVRSIVNSYGISYDHIMVLVKNQGGGGGGGICVVGTIYHDAIHTGNVGVHELGHTAFGLQHDGGFMNMSCNQGACGEGGTFTPAQLNTINQRLNQTAGVFNSPPPTIQIVSPANNYTTEALGSLRFSAEVTGLVQYVEVFYDNVLKGTLPYWERNAHCNPTNGVLFWISPLSPGQHTMTMKATDINNQTAEHSITVNIQ